LLEFILAETGRRRLLVPLPFGLAMWKAFFLQFLPNPPLTPDQVRLLRHDNVVGPAAPGLADLGIVPTTVEAEVPAYLWRYRPRGQYDTLAKADYPSASQANRARPARMRYQPKGRRPNFATITRNCRITT
jgi:NADH dehydrogenase